MAGKGMGIGDLAPELRDTDLFQVMRARRVATSARERLMHLVPYPEGVDVKNPLPEWTRLPLSSKIPLVQAPKDYTVYMRGKLGESVRRQGSTFDLSDPHNYGLQMKYESIHDKHLKHYYYMPGNKKILEDMGILTKEDQVKCNLHEYNAYRGYVYNVHKNSVLKALRAKDELDTDRAEARKFFIEAAKLRASQAGLERKTKRALFRTANRRVVQVCRKLLCQERLKRLEKVNEKKLKQKEQEQLKLIISQKNFQEQLKDYKIKSQEVNWRRNIRAQNKWKHFLEKEEYKKDVTKEVDRIKKMHEVIENWIRKEIYQMKTRQRDVKINNAYQAYYNKRKAAREKAFQRAQQENAKKFEEIKKYGPTPPEVLEKRAMCQSVGDIYVGLKKLPPQMSGTDFNEPMMREIMRKALNSTDKKSLAKKYWAPNKMKTKLAGDFSESILQCVYMRSVKLYLRYAIFRYLPILITELNHVVALFEEDMERKNCTVDEIRRFVRSYVGQRKGDIFHEGGLFTSYGLVGGLKRRLYKTSRGPERCKCDSESERVPAQVQFAKVPTSAWVDPERKVSFKAEVAVQSRGARPTTKMRQTVRSPKANLAKAKKRKTASILKKCPLRRKLDKETDDGAEYECCAEYVDEACQCNKEVKKVTFMNIAADSMENIRERDEDKANMKVSFQPKPNIIYIPIDAIASTFEIPLLNRTVGEKTKAKVSPAIQVIYQEDDDYRMVSESDTCEVSNFSSRPNSDICESLNNQLSTEKQKSGGTKKIDKFKFPVGKIKITSPNRENVISKDLTSAVNEAVQEHDYDEAIRNIFDKYGEKKIILVQERHEYSSTSSSSSSETKLPIENAEDEISRNSGTEMNATEKKKGKMTNEYSNDDGKFDAKISNPQLLAYDGGKHNNDVNLSKRPVDSECKIYNYRNKSLDDVSKKKKLNEMFEKYIAKEKPTRVSQTDDGTGDEFEDPSYQDFQNEKEIPQVPEKEKKEEKRISIEVISKLIEEENIKSIGSEEKLQDNENINQNEQKRGTQLRTELANDVKNNLLLQPEPHRNGNFLCLKQIFQPSKTPDYKAMVNKESIESILRKTKYAPEENCLLVEKGIKQYKLKDAEDLKKFVLHRITLDEPEALAAVKTEENALETPEGSVKSCKANVTNKIDLGILKTYAKEVMPGSSEQYRRFARVHKMTPLPTEQKRADDYDDDNEVSESPYFVETGQGKGAPFSRDLVEAVPEVNEIYNEFFKRDWPEVYPLYDAKEERPKQHKPQDATKSKERFSRKKFATPEDVIRDAINYKEMCLRGEIGIAENTCEGGKLEKRHARQRGSRGEGRRERKVGAASSDSSEDGRRRIPERHGFSFLEARLFEADGQKLCEVCGTCPIPGRTETNLKKLVECEGCGACVHQMSGSEEEGSEDSLSTQSARRPPRPQRPPTPEPSDGSQPDLAFLNDTELKALYWEKARNQIKSCADLRAIFGRDFDNDKFVYFVAKDKDYICRKDIMKRRYPVSPFPWDENKLARLNKRKLRIKELKEYTHPKDILRRKVTEGYSKWESSKVAELKGGKEEMKWNKVPKKYEKLFSTTVSPANKPARTWKPVKNHTPTPMPSLTDLVISVTEESQDMYEAREKMQKLRAESTVIKTKVDTAVRALMESLTNIAIIKLKEGYPDIKKVITGGKAQFYYVPTGYHKHSAEKLARGLAEILYGLELRQINFSRLQPIANIILGYVLEPSKHPLIFPDNAIELLDMSDDE